MLSALNASLAQLVVCTHRGETLVLKYYFRNLVYFIFLAVDGGVQPFGQIRSPSSGFFGAFPHFPAQQERQTYDDLIDIGMLVDEVHDRIQSTEGIAVGLDIAFRVRQRELRVAQSQTDPGISQIDTQPSQLRQSLCTA